jgi:hypothetical protein
LKHSIVASTSVVVSHNWRWFSAILVACAVPGHMALHGVVTFLFGFSPSAGSMLNAVQQRESPGSFGQEDGPSVQVEPQMHISSAIEQRNAGSVPLFLGEVEASELLSEFAPLSRRYHLESTARVMNHSDVEAVDRDGTSLGRRRWSRLGWS